MIGSMLNSSQQGYNPCTYLHPSAWTSSLLTTHFAILHFGFGTESDELDKIVLKNVFVVYVMLLWPPSVPH